MVKAYALCQLFYIGRIIYELESHLSFLFFLVTVTTYSAKMDTVLLNKPIESEVKVRLTENLLQ